MNDQLHALRGAQHVVSGHGVAGNPVDLRMGRLRPAGEAAHGPAVARQCGGGLTADAASGADDEGNPGGVGHLVSPGVDPVLEPTMPRMMIFRNCLI